MAQIVFLIVVVVLVAIAVFWFIGAYNRLVGLRNRVDTEWAQIDVQLKRRYDLIPNLVETVKGYAAHERQTLERVIEARNRALASTGSPQSQAKDENALVGMLRQLFALSEGYPELKASRNFLQLQQELANTEDRIQAARRFYNANVRDLNTRVEVFPSNLVARALGFTKQEFFEIEDAGIRAPVAVNLS